MLSPGEWHKLVPKEPEANAKFREELLRQARGDERLRRAIVKACGRDLLFWVNVFVIQYNAQHVGEEVGPFVTWDFQDAAMTYGDGENDGILQCVEDRCDLVIEKSREMGASWMCLIVVMWLWLFHGWKQFLCVSKSEAAVDGHSPSALFWKIDFMLRHLPRWMRPSGWSPKKHRLDLYFENPENGSTITGEASTGRAGVGGRATAAFIDEFSQIKEDKQLRHRTADTTRCRIWNFTHTGLDTEAYKLTQEKGHRTLRMHWSQHPEKRAGLYRVRGGQVEVLDRGYHYDPDFEFVTSGAPTGGPYPGLRSVWYDNECQRRQDPREIAMDLDINPQGAMSQFFDPLKIQVLMDDFAGEPVWEGILERQVGTKGVRLVRQEGGGIKLWLRPNGHGEPALGKYAAGADIATGRGVTPSVLSIANVETGEKVLEYADAHITEEDFAELAVGLCRLFRDAEGTGARLCWEANGPGATFGKRVVELGYGNIYFRTDELPQSMVPKVSLTPGWNSGIGINKRVTLEDYRLALYQRKFLNRSRAALLETLAFRYAAVGGGVEHAGERGDDPASARLNHGDRVIADALCWKMCKALAYYRRAEGEVQQARPGSLAWRREMAEEEQREQQAWA